ncbi:g1858 [Coccomyxa viridis]|uniref:G1858 protein n=1 Tax=Coccomyxa viridis TaxID=1274662 RepID=A0ABP1FQX1_9CHLO
MACKRLRDLQLSSHIYVKEYTSLQWLLKRSQHVKSINLLAEERPGGVNELRNLSMPLIEVSCNLQHLEELDLQPILNAPRPSRRSSKNGSRACYRVQAILDVCV